MAVSEQCSAQATRGGRQFCREMPRVSTAIPLRNSLVWTRLGLWAICQPITRIILTAHRDSSPLLKRNPRFISVRGHRSSGSQILLSKTTLVPEGRMFGGD